MTEHNRRGDDLTEPKTSEELTRQIWRDVKDIKSVTFGKDGLCNRMTVLETIVNVLAWIVGVGVPSLGVIVGWMLIFRKGNG